MPKSLTWSIVGTALLLGLALGSRTSADPDLWGHLRFGLDLLESRSLPADDPYSFTQDRPWINHEWASEWQIAVAWWMAGTPGLALVKGLIVVSALLVVWGGLAGTDLAPRMGIFAAAVVGTAQIAQTLRPQLWSFLFLALLCRALTAERARVRWWLPPLFALWANVHGGWVVGIGVLVTWAAVGAWLRPSTGREWAGVVFLSALATLCTPYGWQLWAFLIETVRMTRPMIEEWQPLWAFPPTKWIAWIAAVGATAWALAHHPTAARWQALAVLAMLAYASLRVARISPLFVEATALLLAPAFANRWPTRPPATSSPPTRADWTTAVVVSGAMAAGAVWIGAASLRCIGVEREGMPEVEMVRVLERAEPGRLVTFFDWGQYALWHLAPDLRVSMDGRRETVYSERRLSEHDAILFGRPEGFAVLDEWRAEYVWLPAASAATREWLTRNGYRIDAETLRSFVAVRQDLPRLPRPAPAEGQGPRCFPD